MKIERSKVGPISSSAGVAPADEPSAIRNNHRKNRQHQSRRDMNNITR